MSKLKLGDGLTIPIEISGQAVALVGIRGSGKTNTAGVIAEELLTRSQQIVVIDPTDAWWGLRSDFPVFIFGGPHGDLPLTESDGKTLAEFVVQEQVPIILSLRHLRKGAQRRLVTEFCEELYHLKGKPEYRSPLTMFIDEAPQFVPQRVTGDMARLVGAVQDMILLGRNVGFGVVLISQRFATLNADVRTQADTILVHRLPSPLDRKALTEWIEENATIDEQKDVLSSLAKLQTGEAWIWAPYFDLFRRAQIRARKTFDSSAAPKHGAVVRPPKDLKTIDLEKLKGKLADAIERRKADDPAELKRQIAELKKQASSTPVSVPPERKAISTPVLTDADRVLLAKVAAALSERVANAIDTISLADSWLDKQVQKAAAEYLNTVRKVGMDAALSVEQVLDRVGFQKVLTKLATAQPAVAMSATTRQTVRQPVPAQASRSASPAKTPAEGLDGSQQNILDVVAMLGVRGIAASRDSVARWLDIHPNGGRYGSNLAHLRAEGYLDGFNLTEKGTAAARAMATGLQAAREPLDGSQREIIDALETNAGKRFTRDTLAAALGIHPNGGRYGSNLARLRTMGLIPDRGDIYLTEAAGA